MTAGTYVHVRAGVCGWSSEEQGKHSPGPEGLGPDDAHTVHDTDKQLIESQPLSSMFTIIAQSRKVLRLHNNSKCGR